MNNKQLRRQANVLSQSLVNGIEKYNVGADLMLDACLSTRDGGSHRPGYAQGVLRRD